MFKKNIALFMAISSLMFTAVNSADTVLPLRSDINVMLEDPIFPARTDLNDIQVEPAILPKVMQVEDSYDTLPAESTLIPGENSFNG